MKRLEIVLTVMVATAVDDEEVGEQVFSLVGSDENDLAPLVAEVENYEVRRVDP